MKKIEYLNGNLILETLELESDEFGRFRNTTNERGEVSMIISETNLQYLEFAEFKKKGVKRGYHYHNKYIEKLYLISGKIIILAKLLENSESIELTVSAGDLLTIKPGVAHAFFSLKKTLSISMGSNAPPFKDRFIYPELKFSFEL